MKARDILLFMLLFGACQGFESSFGSRNDIDAAPKAKGSDTGRPSEDGEGVPGYLVDPRQIRAQENGDYLEIRGSSGAIIGNPGAVQIVRITATQVDDTDRYPAEGVESIVPNSDGSFIARIDASYADELVGIQPGSNPDYIYSSQPNDAGHFRAGAVIDGRRVVGFTGAVFDVVSAQARNNTEDVTPTTTTEADSGIVFSPTLRTTTTLAPVTTTTLPPVTTTTLASLEGPLQLTADVKHCHKGGIGPFVDKLDDLDLDSLEDKFDDWKDADFDMHQCTYTDATKTKILIEVMHKKNNTIQSIIVNTAEISSLVQ